LQFQWKDSKSGTVEVDVVLQPPDVQYQKVSECTTADVYLLTIKRKESILITRHFFWSQEPKASEKDKEFCFLLNYYLKNYEPDIPVIGAEADLQTTLSSLGRCSTLDALDLQRILSGVKIVGAQNVLSTLIAKSFGRFAEDDSPSPPESKRKLSVGPWSWWEKQRTEAKQESLARKASACATFLKRLENQGPARRAVPAIPTHEHTKRQLTLPGYQSPPPKHKLPFFGKDEELLTETTSSKMLQEISKPKDETPNASVNTTAPATADTPPKKPVPTLITNSNLMDFLKRYEKHE